MWCKWLWLDLIRYLINLKMFQTNKMIMNEYEGLWYKQHANMEWFNFCHNVCTTLPLHLRLGHIRTNGPMMQKVNTGVARMWTTINTYILIPVQELHLTYTGWRWYCDVHNKNWIVSTCNSTNPWRLKLFIRYKLQNSMDTTLKMYPTCNTFK